jgi:LEA14-like dessication related protein
MKTDSLHATSTKPKVETKNHPVFFVFILQKEKTMSKVGKKIILACFVVATMVWVGVMLQTFSFYYGAYTAIRALSVSISELNVKWIDSTRAQTVTIVTLNNPSNCEFIVLGVEQRVSLNNHFIAYGRASISALRISPQSSSNVTIALEVPYQYIELLQEPSQKAWLALVYTFLEGPLVGRFSLRTSRQIITY